MFERWVKMAYYSPVGMIKIGYEFSQGATGKEMLFKYPWLKEIGDEWWVTASSLYEKAIFGAPLSPGQIKKALGNDYEKAKYLWKYDTVDKRKAAKEHLIKAVADGAEWTVVPGDLRRGEDFIAGAKEHLRKNVLNKVNKNTTGCKLINMPYGIFDNNTKDILVNCEWFCLEIVSCYDHLTRWSLPRWVTDNWRQKVRLAGTIKDNGDRDLRGLNMRAHRFYNLPI